MKRREDNMKKEEYCCIFDTCEKDFKNNRSFEIVKKYGEIDSPNSCTRSLLKCKKCGKLFLYQFLEWNVAGFDDYYDDFIQVESEEEADNLNSSLLFSNFRSNTNPMICIGADNITNFKTPK